MQESIEDLRLLIENLRDIAIVMIDLRGRVTNWSPAVERILGYGEDEFVGQPAAMVFTPEDRANAVLEQEMKAAETKGRAEDKRWHLRKDGTRFWCNGLMVSLRDESNALRGFAKVMRDETERKLDEERLRESEERYRVIAETASDAIVTIDEENTILFVNAAAENIFGYKIEEMRGARLTMLMPEYLRHLHEAGLTRYLETNRRHISWAGVEVTGLHKSGREIPLEISFGEFIHIGRRFFTGIIRDITERRRIDNALKESEERFQRLVELSPDAIVVHVEGQITFINSSGMKLLRATSPEQIIGKPIMNFVHSDFHDTVGDRLRMMSAGEIVSPTEMKYVRLDGTEIYGELMSVPFTYKGKPAVQAVVRDITERKRAEETLREREEQFSTLANSIPQLAWMADSEGYIFWYNQRWYDYTGTTLEEMRGWGWQTVHDPAVLEGVIERFKQSLATGEPWEDTFPLRSKEGEYRHFLSRALPIRNAEGRIVRWFGTNTDVEEKLRAEEERERLLKGEREARLQAEKANRLKDEFLATLSHELRTPLTSIYGWARLLRSGKLDPDASSRALEVIERNAHAQRRLIDDILDVSRIITGNLRLSVQPIALVPVIEAAVDAVRPAADAKHIQLQINIEPQTGVISGDPDRLQQIVWNLLSNAIKFTPEEGRVELQLSRFNSTVQIKVSDTGEGIEEEFLPFVFERFRQANGTTTRRHGGLGLGLAIVRHLVELHGGTVAAKSRGREQGSTFTVTFPVARTATGAKQSRRAQDVSRQKVVPPISPPVLNDLRVLVVDDEADTLEFLTMVMEGCGAHVTAAASVSEARDALANARFDFLLSDIGMPGEDGYALIRHVRALEKEHGGHRIPAMALTAYAREEDRLKSLRAGFQMHMSKPVDPEELLAVVASFAGRTDSGNSQLAEESHDPK